MLLPQTMHSMPKISRDDLDRDDYETGLRRRSSQIISDSSFQASGGQQLGREREDSITAFKKFEKGILQDYNMIQNQRLESAGLSPNMQVSTPQVPGALPVNTQMMNTSPMQNGLQQLIFSQ